MRKLLYGLVIVVMGYSANILVSPAGVEPATSWLKGIDVIDLDKLYNTSIYI